MIVEDRHAIEMVDDRAVIECDEVLLCGRHSTSSLRRMLRWWLRASRSADVNGLEIGGDARGVVSVQTLAILALIRTTRVAGGLL